METLAQRLQRLRLQKDLSIREVALKLGVSHSTYRAWEYGAQIRGEPYGILSELFEVSLSELLTGKSTGIEGHLKTIEETARLIRTLI